MEKYVADIAAAQEPANYSTGSLSFRGGGGIDLSIALYLRVDCRDEDIADFNNLKEIS